MGKCPFKRAFNKKLSGSRFDNELDKNGDNALNREEILGWIVPSNEEIANEEVCYSFLSVHLGVMVFF